MKTITLLALEVERLIATRQVQPIEELERELFKLAEAVQRYRKQFSSHPLPARREKRRG